MRQSDSNAAGIARPATPAERRLGPSATCKRRADRRAAAPPRRAPRRPRGQSRGFVSLFLIETHEARDERSGIRFVPSGLARLSAFTATGNPTPLPSMSRCSNLRATTPCATASRVRDSRGRLLPRPSGQLWPPAFMRWTRRDPTGWMTGAATSVATSRASETSMSSTPPLRGERSGAKSTDMTPGGPG
jgi:hypothetical protein